MSEFNINYEGYIQGDNLLWNQSFYFNFYDPKCKVGGLIRLAVMENIKESNNYFLFFIDGKPAFTRINQNLPYTSGRPDKGLEIAGIRATSLDPLKKARIEYSSPDFKVDLLYEVLHPMADAIAMTQAKESTLAAELCNVHLEGASRVTGTITLRGGKLFEIDGIGNRDISVGPRNWDSLLYYTTSWPVFTNGLAFALIHAVSTTGHHSYMKMYYDGKQWQRVNRLEDRNELEDDGIRIKSQHWKFWDHTDRIWEYTGKSLFAWPCPFDTFVTNEQMMEYRLSDGTVGYGLAETGFRYDALRPGPEADILRTNILSPLRQSS